MGILPGRVLGEGRSQVDTDRGVAVGHPPPASAAGAVPTTKPAKYQPAASLITVTEDGTVSRVRDYVTRTSPIFGRSSRPRGAIDQRAWAANRIDCRASLQDLKRGGPGVGLLRSPLQEAKKLP
ncbi:hypothetical protein OG806_49175 [Streptomyces sp. NBC_00882]|uniref:hypothetical protein n=1 Tax=Streptomyces TaxID=1883 RepID=UPI003863BADB|nr:hypothetical protein OG806_49175 [Streptomyces sp. NBC_00882]WSZ63785.1 hypothetical protein OH824_48455 [Streptomyces canus]